MNALSRNDLVLAQTRGSSNIKLSVLERRKRFLKFCLVVLDDDEVEEMFHAAYTAGIESSSEPLYNAYCELKRSSEPTEQEAFAQVLERELPRQLKRPGSAATRYPVGSGR